jgi:hypothetical protein
MVVAELLSISLDLVEPTVVVAVVQPVQVAVLKVQAVLAAADQVAILLAYPELLD